MAVTFLDPATHSVSLASADTWTDIDNADVPDTAVAVIVRATNSNATTNRNVGWRKNGSTDARTTVMRSYERFGFIVGCDGSGIFELLAGETTDVTFKIVGYLQAADVVMFDNATDVSTATTGSYVDVDITGLIGANDAIGVFCEWINTGADNYAVRCNGSTDDRYRTQVQHWFTACAVDANDIFEIEIANTGTDTFVTGYALAGGCLSFNVNATDMSLGGIDAYTDLANLPANSAGAIFEILSNTTSYYYALRKNGGTDDDYYYARAHCWDIVEAASLVVEGKIQDLNVDFFRIAEFTTAAGGSSITKNISEIENLYETINKIPGYPKYIQEIEQLLEAINRRETLLRWISELVNIREVVQYRLTLTRWISELVNVFEVITYRKTMYRFISELVNIYEGIGKASGVAKIVSELVNIYEAVGKTTGFAKVVSELVSITETVSQNKTLRRFISELINAYEAVGRNAIYVRIVNEIENIYETIARRNVLSRVISEIVNIYEAVGSTLTVPAALTKFIVESLGISEGIPKVKRPIGRLVIAILTSIKNVLITVRDHRAVNDK